MQVNTSKDGGCCTRSQVACLECVRRTWRGVLRAARRLSGDADSWMECVRMGWNWWMVGRDAASV